eukprot:CAMPEP_0168324650 /NCGR_PEP_ID=MMETSP0213-20121227/4215_1 /TAXON_ID=151035 /ORGANISM="Euplotes harpa, Strain FSP1.4" /LENGTH=53 /DNA_ID=CAMNT_0008326977 /DNA_START=850 /DNA_END=1007 /DNA_ORIENTATION=-
MIAAGEGPYGSVYGSSGRGGAIMIDGIPVPPNIGNGMGTAMGTIFTWEQIFNS